MDTYKSIGAPIALAIVGICIWAAWRLWRRLLEHDTRSVDISVTIMLDGQILTDDAWTDGGLDKDNARRMGTTFLAAAAHENHLSSDPTPKGAVTLTRLNWPRKGWRLSRGVLTADGLQPATLAVIMKKQANPRK